MANNFVTKLWQNYLRPALIALPFRNGMGCHNRNVRINSVNDVVAHNLMDRPLPKFQD